MARNTKKIMSVNGLKAAARMADIDSLYRLVEQDPHVLKYIDSMQIVETPLHVVAASVDLSGHIQFATEIMTLKPSFALKLNPQGLTPIHLALEKGHNRMALHLIGINKDLVRAKKSGGVTPLHLASQYGDIGRLKIFLEACPDSIEDITVTGETALHLAVQNNFEAFKFLVKWLRKKTLQLEITILNRKDVDGNTILHIAALNNATQAIVLLTEVTTSSMDFDAVNLMEKTALNLAHSAHIKRMLVRAKCMRKTGLIGQLALREPMTEERRNAYLVVATLVATATYQAVLSPPGGFHQTDLANNNTLTQSASNSFTTEGESIMSGPLFTAYSTINSCAFLVSTFTIISLLPRDAARLPLLISISLLILSYYFSTVVISPRDVTAELFTRVLYVFLVGSFLVVLRPGYMCGGPRA